VVDRVRERASGVIKQRRGERIVLGLDSRSAATHRGLAESSATTRHSVGPRGRASDADLAEDHALGQHHEDVAWPDDLVDARHGLGAVGQCGDGLGATQSIDRVDAATRRARQDVGNVAAGRRWRRGEHESP
jgi:hypothetical protein